MLSVPRHTELEMGNLTHQTEGRLTEPPAIPSSSFQTEQPVQQPALSWMLDKNHSFSFLLPFCKFMFLAIPVKEKSRKNWFGLIKITKTMLFFLLPLLTLKKIIPERTF